MKCFCQLTLQAPIIATLLSIISRSNREFPELVLQKLLTQLNSSLKTGDVLVARNLIRVLSCLTSTKTLMLEDEPSGGDGTGTGFLSLLNILCSIAESETSSFSSYSIQVEAAIFLLASSVPYFANILYDKSGNSSEVSHLLTRIVAICRTVAPIEETLCRRSSRYDVGGSHAVFHVNIEGTTPPTCANDPTSLFTPQSTSPTGAVCWDSLWEVGLFYFRDNIIISRYAELLTIF